MRGVNKVIIIGNAGGDPEVRYLPNGNAVANVAVATSLKWKDKQTGEVKERTEWHRVAFFGKIAEIAGEYLRKGQPCYIEGRLQTRKWQKDGQDHYTTEIVVDQNGTFQLLSKPEGGQSRQPQAQPQRQPQAQPGATGPDYDSFDDDIPFRQLPFLAGV